MSNSSPSTSLDAGQEAAPLDWLLSLLREAMVGVMADDTPALKKANAIARLGNLYLKTYDAADLRRINARLVERVAALEERLTATGVGMAAGEEDVAGRTVPEDEVSAATRKTKKASPPKSRSHGRLRPARRRHSRPGPWQKTAGGAAGRGRRSKVPDG